MTRAYIRLEHDRTFHTFDNVIVYNQSGKPIRFAIFPGKESRALKPRPITAHNRRQRLKSLAKRLQDKVDLLPWFLEAADYRDYGRTRRDVTVSIRCINALARALAATNARPVIKRKGKK